MRKRYDVIVVGSGFGGAVAACRFAQAGLRVAILERGRRYPLGGFPRNFTDPFDGWMWEHEQGLFDVRPINEITVVQAAAYGGGSHIYANVQLRMPPDGFDHGWPQEYSRTVLDPYYDLVAYMLDVKPIRSDQPLGLPPRTRQMREVARKLGRGDQFFFPNLALNFGDPAVAKPNRFGVQQFGCRHCAECDIGCNYQSKNTLDLNYLAVAEQRGADVGTQCEVTRLEQRDNDYEVIFFNHAEGAEERVQARTVVLGAGAVNTTELLLRCRDQYGTLPKLSDRLGHRYSGNGDFLAFGFGTKERFDAAVGPVITTTTVFDRGSDANRRWFILQDGGVPTQVVPLLQVLGSNGRFGSGLRVQREMLDAIRRVARKRLGGGVATDPEDDVAVFLEMGRDSADGVIELLPFTHDIRITWNVRENLALYETQQQLCEDVVRALGGTAAFNPLWERLRVPVTVHNLGGFVMADDPGEVVTNSNGEVFGYPNLYVFDGGCLPSATGVNPAHTIAAVAERNAEAAVRKITGRASWVAPERKRAAPVTEPLDAVTIPPAGTPAAQTLAVGLSFTETMRGFLRRGHRPAADFRGAAEAGRRAGTAVSFTLDVATPFLTEFLADETHQLTAQGTVHVDGVTGSRGARVGAGVVNLLVRGDNPTSRRMIYTLPFIGADGAPYLLDGFKDVRDHGSFDVWGSTTTLYTYLRRGHSVDGEVLATGILYLPALTFVRQVATARVTGTHNPLRQAEAVARFGQMFLGSLWSVFVAPRLRLFSEVVDGSADPTDSSDSRTVTTSIPGRHR
ncbi:MAG: GMC oxidoreductase [Pseudonocardiaceae bacterium]